MYKASNYIELLRTDREKEQNTALASLLEEEKNHPDSYDLLYRIGLFYETRLHLYQKALEYYKQVLVLCPAHLLALHSSGFLFYRLLEDDAALASFLKLIELKPDHSALAWLIAARILSRKGDKKQAFHYYNKALQYNPGFNIRLEVAKSLFALDRYEDVLSLLEEENPQTSDEIATTSLIKAASFVSLKKFSQAASIFDQHLNLTNADVHGKKFFDASHHELESAIYYRCAQAMNHLDRNQEAYHAIQKALPLYTAEAWVLKGELELKLNLPKDALLSFQKVIEMEPEHTEALLHAGTIMLDQKKFQDALQVFEKILDQKPDHLAALNGKALIYQESGNMEGANQIYERLIQLEPDNPISWFQHGVTMDYAQEYAKALHSYDEAIRLNSNYGSAHSNRGYDLYLLKRYDEAIESYTRSIEIKPDYAGAWYNRSCSRTQAGDYENALMDLEQAVQLKGRYAELAFNDDDFSYFKSENSPFAASFLIICKKR